MARRFDLPFAENGSGRFLPWMIALMVYLAALATAAALTTREVVQRWNAGLEGTATVEVAPAASDAATDALVAQAIAVLRNTPGVAAAEPVPLDEIGRLLEPWLGPDAAREGLPVPRLIDVRFTPGARADTAALSRALVTAVPGARLDSHALWLDRLRALGDSVQLAALVIVLLIAAAAGATVVFATRAGLAVHAKFIELMHLIGSRDSYIARQFQNHAASLALRGGVVGVLIGAATIGTLTVMSRPIRAAVLPDVSIGGSALVALALLPLLAAGIAMLTARMTVLRALRQMT
jgi:cell division transport system permease protein